MIELAHVSKRNYFTYILLLNKLFRHKHGSSVAFAKIIVADLQITIRSFYRVQFKKNTFRLQYLQITMYIYGEPAKVR